MLRHQSSATHQQQQQEQQEDVVMQAVERTTENQVTRDHNVQNNSLSLTPMNQEQDIQPNVSHLSSRGATINLDVANIRAEMNPLGIRMKSKATSTGQKHNNENAKLIFWLYENRPDCLCNDLCHRLDDLKLEVDYSDLVHRKYTGKKSLEQRQNEYVLKTLDEEIKSALGPVGTDPERRTVKFEVFESDLNIYLDYICAKKKKDGALMKAGVYKGYRSSLTYLFRRYKHPIPDNFNLDLADCMQGVKRIANQAIQSGDGNIYDGSRPLTFPLYCEINKWFLELGTHEGIFAAAFAKVTFNLACRGDSTGRVRIKHLQWCGDSTGIPFAHEKANQTGENSKKKLPRHCYSNPFDVLADFSSGVFDYLALFPDILSDKDGPLFSGSLDKQTDRFAKQLNIVLKAKQREIEESFGFDLKDISVHSYRKAAHTRLNCGSTAGPTAAAACIRGGHSLGGSRDVYVVQEQASDQLCGRILAGLDILKSNFGTSYPDFVPIDVAQSLESGVSAEDFTNKKKEVDEIVSESLVSIFGEQNLTKCSTLVPFLRVGLASHLQHIDKILEYIPTNAPLRLSPLFTISKITSLREHVRIAMPWEESYKYFAPATGLPPHTIQMKYFEQISADIKNIVPQMEKILDNRQFNGQISLAQMKNIMNDSSAMARITTELSSLRKELRERTLPQNTFEVGENVSGIALGNRVLYNHSDGILRRVPTTWKFPQSALHLMYMYWHLGDENNGVSPMKFFRPIDVNFLPGRAKKNLAELRFIMTTIDDGARRKGLGVQAKMSSQEVHACFEAGKDALKLGSQTPSGRARNLKTMRWSSVYKIMEKKKKKSSARAR